jgi:hypothetical protein
MSGSWWGGEKTKKGGKKKKIVELKFSRVEEEFF